MLRSDIDDKLPCVFVCLSTLCVFTCGLFIFLKLMNILHLSGSPAADILGTTTIGFAQGLMLFLMTPSCFSVLISCCTQLLCLRGNLYVFWHMGGLSPVSTCTVTRFVQPVSWLLNENTYRYSFFNASNLSFVSCEICWSFRSTWWCSVTCAGEKKTNQNQQY